MCCLFAGLASAGDNPRGVRAIRVATPPRIDGVLDDQAWKLAEPATDFIQRDPEEGKLASERSEIRVLYDDEALYFGCLFYDSDPQKIVSRLTRRDDESESDGASIRIDSYHDLQTGYEFTFNVSGVKIDILQYDDAQREDNSWDPVWELETHITPEGWVAEIKIPFYILHYRKLESDTAENVWGINFLRHISRKQEDERWAFTPKKESGFISRFGHLYGLKGLKEQRQFEALPFVTGKASYFPASAYRDRTESYLGDGGIDLKYGLSSNFTLDATINPDFGQVEADPAVLNLSTFETFYPEKRPFFIEGTQILRFSTFGGGQGPGMFYSRRIGRAISEDEASLPPDGKIIDIPNSATILGAVKINGKTNSGLSIGVLEAFTQEEKASLADSTGALSEQVLEPFAHYNVIRLKQDVLNNSNVGLIVTSVEKNGRAPAFTNGYDWNLIFGSNTYSLNGFLALSSTNHAGDERLNGSAGKVSFGKIAAEHWLWNIGADYTSKQYNINDVGFFFSPNDYGVTSSVTYKEDVPAASVRNYNISTFLHYRQNFDDINLGRQMQVSSSILFTNYWQVSASGGFDAGMYDARETRGNGLYRKPVTYSASAQVSSDQRSDVYATFGQQYGWDSKIKHQWTSQLFINMKPLSWMTIGLESAYQRIRTQEAWFTNTDAGEALFGDRSTDNLSVTLRGSVTFTRELTLQAYGQEFFATGHYENIRALVGDADFVPYSYSGNPDFDRQSFNSNIVLRWEYLPGSLLYLVWSQARAGSDDVYNASFQHNLDDTFNTPPSNVFLLKISYLIHI